MLLAPEDGGPPRLTDFGEQLRKAPPNSIDRLFARHIITSCNGQRLIDSIALIQLRGERPLLRDLAREMDRHETSKNVSTMRAWLARAGVFPDSRGYRLDEQAVDQLLGSNIGAAYGLSDGELEFVLAARLLRQQSGVEVVRASEAADLAESRNLSVRIPRKSLGSFVNSLESRGVLVGGSTSGAGGVGRTVQLLGSVAELAEDQLRQLLAQSNVGFALQELAPLNKILDSLGSGSTHDLGKNGEMLAVHLCLALGLRVVAWRSRAPSAEIDLIAERTVALTYQRWAIQVKNTAGKLTNDRVDREVGAAAGTGTTHILFVVPRSELTQPARSEIITRSRLTGKHIYHLTHAELSSSGLDIAAILASLASQANVLGRVMKDEAQRRESPR